MEDWKQLTVGAFLRQVNWRNLPESGDFTAGSSSLGPLEDLQLQLPVARFFAAIPWTGKSHLPTQRPRLHPAEASEHNLGKSLPLALPELDEFADGSGNSGEDITLDDFFGSFASF